MTLEELLNNKNMKTINLFSFKVTEGPTLTLESSDIDITIEITADEFGNKGFKIYVSDSKTHIKIIREGTDLNEELKEALTEWKTEFEEVLKTSKYIDNLLSVLNDN